MARDKKVNKSKKTRIYECAFFEFEYDDLGKYCWCHSPKNPNRMCDVHWKVCSKFCPYYKKKTGRNAYVVIELDENDKELMAEAKKKLEKWRADRKIEKEEAEKAEYKMYLRLKKKYGET